MFDTISYKIKDLYETKAEAEFVAKYGNITRIEKMPVPPMWEEFKSYGMKFYNNQIPTTLDISKNMNLIYLTQGFHGEKNNYGN